MLNASSSHFDRYCRKSLRKGTVELEIETTRFHHAAGRRGDRVAARGARAAAGDAGGRVPKRGIG